MIHEFIVRVVEPPAVPVQGTLLDLEDHAHFFMPLDPYLGAHVAKQFGEDFATGNYLTVSEKRKAEKNMRRKAERELYFVEHPAPPDFIDPNTAPVAFPEQPSGMPQQPPSSSPPHSGLCKSVRASRKPSATLAPEVRERIQQNRAAACQRKLERLQASLALHAPVSLIPNSPPRLGDVLRSVDTMQLVPMQIGCGATVRKKFRFP